MGLKEKFKDNLVDLGMVIGIALVFTVVLGFFGALLALPIFGALYSIYTDNLVLALTCGLFMVPWWAGTFALIEVLSDKFAGRK